MLLLFFAFDSFISTYECSLLFVFLSCCSGNTIFSSGNTHWNPVWVSNARAVLQFHPNTCLFTPQKALHNSVWLARFACDNTGTTNCSWITESSTHCCQCKPMLSHAKAVTDTTPESYFPEPPSVHSSLSLSSPFPRCLFLPCPSRS